MTEGELRALISSSQKDGFRELFRCYKSYVYSIVWSKLKYTGRKEDAEECISDIFTQIFLHFDEIDEGSLKAYTGKVASGMAVDRFRRLTAKKNLLTDGEEISETIPSDEDIEVNSEYTETNRMILEKIKSLGKPDSDIIIQKYYYDRSSDEIASSLDMSPSNVRMRLSRALKRLKKIFSEENFV